MVKYWKPFCQSLKWIYRRKEIMLMEYTGMNEEQERVQRESRENGGMGTPGRYLGSVRKQCSRLGFALIIIIAFSYISSFAWKQLVALMTASRSSAGQEAVHFLIDRGAVIALSSLCGYLVSLPLAARFLKPFPEEKSLKMKMRAGKFLMLLVLAMGLGYIGSFAGNLINMLISAATGKSLFEMNPVNQMLNMLSWPNILMITVMAPLVEEWIFRKMLLNRVRFLGEQRAIVFTALLFGLMHGNISQTIFATIIGLVLGYAAVKTGRIVHCILIHMIVNSYSVLASLLTKWTGEGSSLSVYAGYGLLTLFGLSVFVFMIAAVVILLLKWNKAVYRKGSVPDGIGGGALYRAVYLNPGMILMYLYCIWETLQYIL